MTQTEPDTEEIIYDDKYRISIPQLVFNNKIDTREQLQRLLNDNGYYGRAVVHTKREFGHPTDLLYVKILLVNSNWKYTWPLNSYYCCRTGKVLPVKSKVKPSPLLREGMETLVYAAQQWKKYDLNPGRPNLYCTLSVYNGNTGAMNNDKIVKQLMHYGLTKDEKFLLSDIDDVHELYYNLFDQKYYV